MLVITNITYIIAIASLSNLKSARTLKIIYACIPGWLKPYIYNL